MSSIIESPRIAKDDEDEDEKKEGGSASSKQLRGAIPVPAPLTQCPALESAGPTRPAADPSS